MRADLQKAYEVAKAWKRLNPLIGKGAYDFLEKQLLRDEQVIYLSNPNVGILTAGEALKIKPFDFKNKTAGIFLITSKRLLHRSKILFNTKVEQIALENINNVESKGGLIFTVLRIQSMTNVMEIDMPNKVAVEVSRMISETIQKSKQPAPAQSAVTDPIEKIKQLGELRDKGVLTEEEFIKKKEELLSKI